METPRPLDLVTIQDFVEAEPVDGSVLLARPAEGTERKGNKLKPKYTIEKAILDALASQRRQGETSLIVRIEPNLIQDALNALPDYRKVFAAVVPGLTDLLPIYETYEQMQQAEGAKQSVLLLVQCQTTQEFREAIDRLPLRRFRYYQP